MDEKEAFPLMLAMSMHYGKPTTYTPATVRELD